MYDKLIPFILSIPLIAFNFSSNLASNTPEPPKVDIVAWQDLVPENDYVLKRIIQEESSGNPEAINPKDTDGFPKYGLLQYHLPTFLSWAEKVGIEEPDVMNPVQQLIVYKWAAKNGKLRHWGTFVRMFP